MKGYTLPRLFTQDLGLCSLLSINHFYVGLDGLKITMPGARSELENLFTSWDISVVHPGSKSESAVEMEATHTLSSLFLWR